MTLLDWAGLLSAVILICVVIVLAFQFGYAKGWGDARKKAKEAQDRAVDATSWPVITKRRAMYIAIAFPVMTLLILSQSPKISLLTKALSSSAHFIILLVQIVIVNRLGSKEVRLSVQNSSDFRLISALTYSVSPLIVPIFLMVKEQIQFNSLSIYLLALTCIFGGLTGMHVTSKPNHELSELKMLHGETTQLIWPYTFFFVLTTISSPFAAQILGAGGLSVLISLLATICVGMISFGTLIVIPLDNLRHFREGILRLEHQREEKKTPDQVPR